MRLLRFLMSVTLSLLPVLGRAEDNQPAHEPKVIVVGGNRDYPPYEFLDKDGHPAGYNLDLMKAIADVMGMRVKFRLGDWYEMRQALDRGEVDVLAGMSYSEGRTKVVDFSNPHTMVSHSIYARRGTPIVGTLKDLEGKEVAFQDLGFIHDYLSEIKLNVKPVLTGTPAGALSVVASGKCDYAVVANLPASYLIKERHLDDVVPIAKSVIAVKYCFAVRRGNTELLSQINEGLAVLKETGEYQSIYNRWLGVLEDQGVPWMKVLKYGSIPATLFLLVLAGTLLWSRTLSRQVAIRTAALEQEISERKRAAEELRLKQQQLVQAGKMASLGTLVSGVAHEINNPNALILMNLPLVSDYLADTRAIVEDHYAQHGDFQVAGLPYSRIGSRINEKLWEAYESAGKVKHIVEDLKDFARMDSRGFDDQVDLNAIAQKAVRLVENTIRKSTQRFEASYAEHLPPIRGNAMRIEQVIVNLLLNACQALRNDGEGIFLSTQFDATAGEIILELRDEGVGIAEEHLAHLTDPFFTTKREQGGTGLGLSVSIGIVKEHRGTLDFLSTPGQGTTAIFRLPAIPSEARS
jgi:polar amino acid transport system substrate-binding protein